MWLIIVAVVVVVTLVGLWLTLRRHRGSGFDRLSREDQVQTMRHRQDGDALRGTRDSAAAQGPGSFGDWFGPGGGGVG